jgi:hypothetical protein
MAAQRRKGNALLPGASLQCFYMSIGQMVTCGLAQWKATVSKQKKNGTKNVI